MGNETSVPSGNAAAGGFPVDVDSNVNGNDPPPLSPPTSNNNHHAPPQGGHANNVIGDANASAAAAGGGGHSVSSPSHHNGSVGLANRPAGFNYQQHHQPQSQQQATLAASTSAPVSNFPQHHKQPTSPPSQQGGQSSSSIISRAGITSMIQRMGGRSSGNNNSMGIHVGSGQGQKGRLKSPVNQNSHQIRYQNEQQQQQQQQQQQMGTPPRGGGSGFSGYGTPPPVTHYAKNNGSDGGVHHQDLSPESKARRKAMLLKRQQEQQQWQQQHSNDVHNQQQQLGDSRQSSYHTAAESERHESSSGTDNDGIVQGMKSVSLSSQQQEQQSKGGGSPPSPRAQLLKKMQNNDEEDWEKAWAEDSESSDDEDDDERKGGAAEGSGRDDGASAEGGPLPIVPDLTGSSAHIGGALKASRPGASVTKAGGIPPSTAVSAAASTPVLPYRPDMDSGHSSASVHVAPPPPPQPFKSQHQQQPQQYIQQQQRLQTIGMPQPVNIPVIQLPAVTPTSQFTAPPSDYPMSQQEIEEDARLVSQANEALHTGDESNRWDTYAAPRGHVMGDDEGATTEEEDERPCPEMFDPALRVLGRGSFGRVVLVQKRQGQRVGSLYAMKILRKSHLVRRRQIDRTKTERRVLSRLDHPFIMKMHYAFQTTEKLYLVLDYCPGGELFFHLSRYRRFQEPVARFYAAELLLAIGHLHKHGIIYRDLKPENVLLDAYGHVKLGDFGLAKDGIKHPTQGAKSTCGTPEYMAPEVLNQGGHGFCVDYWGLGMILYEMMTGLPPWYTTDRSKLFKRLRSAPLIFPKEVHFTPHCRACVAGLLDREPRLRLGVMGLRSAMRHEFFYRRINFDALRARQIAAPIRPCEGWRQFNSQQNSVHTGSEDGGSEHHQQSHAWHSANPSLESAAMGHITAEVLDVATANFDESFRRMPIETEDYERQQQAAGHAPIGEKELNAQTFRGFTFDGDLPPEEAERGVQGGDNRRNIT